MNPTPKRSSTQSSPTPRPTRSIREDEVTTKRDCCQALDWGEKAWREQVRRGFPTFRVGKQVFVDGAAAVAWFRRLAAEQAAEKELAAEEEAQS